MKRCFFCLVAASALLAGCFRSGIPGDGVIKTESRPASSFAKVDATGGYTIKWSSGPPAVSVSTDQNLLPHIKTTITGDTLRIDADASLSPSKTIALDISSPSLASVTLTGGIQFTADQISGKSFKVKSAGASDISLAGVIETLSVELNGASHVRAKALKAQFATLTMNGASDARVNVSDDLNATINGAGSVTYSGTPKKLEKSVNGVGTIQSSP